MKNEFPVGWDEAKVKKVINHYEEQSEEETVKEDEAAFLVEKTLMEVPKELVPKIRTFIAEQRVK